MWHIDTGVGVVNQVLVKFRADSEKRSVFFYQHKLKWAATTCEQALQSTNANTELCE